MPFNLGRRRRRQLESRGVRNEETPNASNPKGWPVIEDYMFSHDDEMIGDFADDIDTLLVFAGLFSAVVTAFVMVSFTMLQPDNTQLSVQLLSVLAIQSGGFAGSESFLNSTATTLPSSTSFQAPTSAITINSLWFTSLILSLASALYGILAKQWCREYLKWYAVLSPSARENVLVRQVRFEAWSRWKVSALISAIPALLEIALVLFLSGLVIFLWTLEKTVAIILTLFIGISLAIALAVTILPVFFPRCPYRSPTGWAFTKLWHLILQGWRCLKYHLGLRDRRRLRPLQDWRERELYALDPPCFVGSMSEQPLIESPTHSSSDSLQVRILLRALSWAHRGSGEGQLANDISQCMPSLHMTHTDRWPYIDPLSTLHALYTISGTIIHSSLFQEVFIDSMCKRLVDKVGYWDSDDYLHMLSPKYEVDKYTFRSVLLMKEGCFYTRGPFVQHPLISRREGNLRDHPWISRRLILQDLPGLLGSWIDDVSRIPGMIGAYQPHTEIVVIMLCLLRCYGIADGWEPEDEDGQDLVDTLCAVYKTLGLIDAAYESGLVSMVAEILCLTGEVIIDCHDCTVSIPRLVGFSPVGLSYTSYDGFIARNLVYFAQQVYEQNLDYSRPNDRQLFVMAADAAVRFSIDTFPSDVILSCMLSAARLSLSKAYKNCGAYCDLPWIASLVERFQYVRHGRDQVATSVLETSFRIQMRNKESLFHLLSAIQESLRIGLITGKGVQEQFDELLQLVDNPELPSGEQEYTNDYVPSGQPPSWIEEDLPMGPCIEWSEGPPSVRSSTTSSDLNNPASLPKTETERAVADSSGSSAQHDPLSSAHLTGPSSPSATSTLAPNISSAVTASLSRFLSDATAVAPILPAPQQSFANACESPDLTELEPPAASSSNTTHDRPTANSSESPFEPLEKLAVDSEQSFILDMILTASESGPSDMI